MKIDLGKYVVTADKYQFILNEKRIAEESGNEYLSVVGYYPQLSQMVKKMFVLDIRESDIKSLQEMAEKIDSLAIELASKINVPG